MKLIFAFVLTIVSFVQFSFAANYVISIDGKEHEIDLGAPKVIDLGDGQNITVVITQKEVVTYSTENFSFDHPSKLTPSRTDLGNGIYQNMVASPRGTLVLIQEYTSLDPSALVDMMLNELTKEEKKYGYKITVSPSYKILADGKKLNGKSATATYRSDENIKNVLTFKGNDAGLLIVTQIDSSNFEVDTVLLETFWKSLTINMQ